LVSSLLAQRNCAVEVLPEFSTRLTGYQANALISIHAGGCTPPNASGFRVASFSGSRLPDEDNRLISCLVQAYGEATDLEFLPGTASSDMTTYHTFEEIAAITPGAVMEIGFLAGDRGLLTERKNVVAQGIAQGIICFLEGE
jgi:N-acetylmuramoyl-L-alanine amidase